MKAPDFWQHDGPLARALSPLGSLYTAAGRLRRRGTSGFRAGIPVICIGNLTMGGTGKTPLAIDLLKRLTERGSSAHVVSRGYGGALRGPHRVDATKDRPGAVGDEPLLLAAHAPTWIARDRAAGIRAAMEAGAEAVVLDDGFQNPGVIKTLSLLAVDAPVGFGNGRVFPAGPLREPVADGLARADAVALIGEGPVPWSENAFTGPILRARIAARFSGMSLTGARVLAFAGIGRPEKFFETVRRSGAILADSEAFPDHNVYSPAILKRLLDRAQSQELMLVTTEKDMVKMPRSMHGKVWPVPVGIVWEDEAAVEALLDRALGTDQ